MEYCFPRVRLTPMPPTPERREGWVRVEVPPGHAGPDEITAYVRAYEQDIRQDLLSGQRGRSDGEQEAHARRF